MSHNKLVRIGSLILFIVPILSLTATEQYWVTLNSSDWQVTEEIKSRSHAEFRFPEAQEWTYFRFSQKFYTKLSKNWTVGVHPAIEGSRSTDSSDFANTYRIDLELNPAKFKLGENGPTVSMRNRWEVRWKEGYGSEVFDRIRQYTTITWDLKNPHLKFYRIGNEVFYEVDKSLITLNRFYPIMLGIPLFDSVSTSFYYMYQTKRSGTSNDWSETHVLGTSIKF